MIGLPDEMFASAKANFDPDFLNGLGEHRSQPSFWGRLIQIDAQPLKPAGKERSLPRG
jgi:hypothetical protein